MSELRLVFWFVTLLSQVWLARVVEPVFAVGFGIFWLIFSIVVFFIMLRNR